VIESGRVVEVGGVDASDGLINETVVLVGSVVMRSPTASVMVTMMSRVYTLVVPALRLMVISPIACIVFLLCPLWIMEIGDVSVVASGVA